MQLSASPSSDVLFLQHSLSLCLWQQMANTHVMAVSVILLGRHHHVVESLLCLFVCR